MKNHLIPILSALAVLLGTCPKVKAQNPNCGLFEWSTKAGGTLDEQGASIAVDDEGNVYVSGYFSGVATFGNFTLTSAGGEDVFIGKLNPVGQWQWAVRVGGPLDDRGLSIGVDGQGNAYVTGYFQGSATFGTSALTSAGSRDIFVTKFNAQGQSQWAVRVGDTSFDQGNSIAVDGLGNSYVTGSFVESANFGSIALYASVSHDIFIAKLNAQGQWQWAVKAGGSTSDQGNAITLDGSSNIYVTGFFVNTSSFGSTTLTSNQRDIFVAKLNAEGQWQWAVKAGGANLDEGYSIGVDAQGNSYVTGKCDGPATFGNLTINSSARFISKLNSQGQWQWVIPMSSVGTIAVDNSGNSFVFTTGQSGQVFGSSTMPQSGVCLAKVNNQGQWQWAILTPGSCIALDGQMNIFTSGGFANTQVFGNTSLSSSGSVDVFVAKLQEVSYTVDAGSDNIIICGNSVNLNSTVSKNVPSLNYYWSPTTGLTGANTATPTARPSTTTTYTVNATTTNGCSATSSVSVIVNPYTVDAGVNADIICGETTNLSATLSATVPGVNYSWSPAAGLTGSNTSTPASRPSATTTYTVSATTNNGCSATSDVTVTVMPFTVNSGSNQAVICGNTVNLNAVLSDGISGVNYSWTPTTGILGSPSTATPSVRPTVTTTYTVNATTNNGCSATDDITITVNPLIVNAGSDQSIVCGSTTNLSSTLNATVPNVTYSWSPTTGLTSGSNTSSPDRQAHHHHHLHGHGQSVAGCTPATDAVQVTVNPLTVNAGSGQAIVCGSTAGLNAALNGTVPNVTYAYGRPVTGLTGPGHGHAQRQAHHHHHLHGDRQRHRLRPGHGCCTGDGQSAHGQCRQ
jgi:hypothetical protein